jgi:hypothetical protein
MMEYKNSRISGIKMRFEILGRGFLATVAIVHALV